MDHRTLDYYGKDVYILTDDHRIRQIRQDIDIIMARKKYLHSLHLISSFSTLSDVCAEDSFKNWAASFPCRIVIRSAPSHYEGSTGTVLDGLGQLSELDKSNSLIISACSEETSRKLREDCCAQGLEDEQLILN